MIIVPTGVSYGLSGDVYRYHVIKIGYIIYPLKTIQWFVIEFKWQSACHKGFIIFEA